MHAPLGFVLTYYRSSMLVHRVPTWLQEAVGDTMTNYTRNAIGFAGSPLCRHYLMVCHLWKELMVGTCYMLSRRGSNVKDDSFEQCLQMFTCRWQRAAKFGLNPPNDIKEIIMRFGGESSPLNLNPIWKDRI